MSHGLTLDQKCLVYCPANSRNDIPHGLFASIITVRSVIIPTDKRCCFIISLLYTSIYPARSIVLLLLHVYMSMKEREREPPKERKKKSVAPFFPQVFLLARRHETMAHSVASSANSLDTSWMWWRLQVLSRAQLAYSTAFPPNNPQSTHIREEKPLELCCWRKKRGPNST